MTEQEYEQQVLRLDAEILVLRMQMGKLLEEMTKFASLVRQSHESLKERDAQIIQLISDIITRIAPLLRDWEIEQVRRMDNFMNAGIRYQKFPM